jgi:phenylacetate-coenzyme A ligase PaaK-like adenylate-forming protein
MTTYAETRARHLADLCKALPGFVERLSWSRPQLELHRRRSLRLLLRVAREYSPWHRERLRDIDPATATEADLERVPPMTRDDLMDHWDEISIYPSVSREVVEAHLERLERDAYLFDTFHAVASNGACGRPGVFLYDWEAWIASFAGCARWRLRNRPGALGGRRALVALLAGGNPRHISNAIHHSLNPAELLCFPPQTSLDDLVRGLEAARPDVLIGYPSVLQALACAAREGRLRIQPAYLNATGEPLPDQLRDELEAVFGARVSNGWAASEALPLGQTCTAEGAMHVNDDLVIAAPVDADGRPVPPGVASAKVHLTNLFNLALPLIRYELTDQVTLSPSPCGCGSAFTRLDGVQGRFDDRFVYPQGVTVEPAALGCVLSRERSVREYQVRQTEHGAEVRLCSDRSLHLRAVGQRVASALGKRGLERPAVSVLRVDRIERLPTGKLRRFVPATEARSQGGPP